MTWLTDLETASGGKPVLLVEGNIDTRILADFLTQLSPGWEVQFVMLSAGSKSRVIEGVRDHDPDWAGVVDTDEWSPAEVQLALTSVPRVRALPRFCLENYFCLPQEIWQAIPPAQRNRIDETQFAQPILAQLPAWVAHGAMWRVIRGRREHLLHRSGFPAELDRAPVTDLSQIRSILTAWYEQLDPDRIISEYQQELTEAEKLASDDQLKTYIHGKKFFRQVVVPTLNQFFDQTRTDIWLQRLTQAPQGLSAPTDLHNFLTDVLALITTQ